MSESELLIESVWEVISNYPDPRIKLLREKTVVQWLCQDTSFLLTTKNKVKELEAREQEWGINILQKHYPKTKERKQWSGFLGECIVKEILRIMGKHVFKAKQIGNIRPDLETNDKIIEVKTQTYYTSGTAGEKVYGTPWKYLDIVKKTSKPVEIVMCGGLEKKIRPNLENVSEIKQDILDKYRDNGINYVFGTDLMAEMVLSVVVLVEY